MRAGALSVRPMRAAGDDLATLAGWFADVQIQEHWDGRDRSKSLEDVRVEFGPGIRGEEPVEPCLIELDGSPVGFVQLYRVGDEPEDPRTADFPGDRGAWALDLFLETAKDRRVWERKTKERPTG